MYIKKWGGLGKQLRTQWELEFMYDDAMFKNVPNLLTYTHTYVVIDSRVRFMFDYTELYIYYNAHDCCIYLRDFFKSFKLSGWFFF